MNIVLWILQVLLELMFLFAGGSKFLMPYEEMRANMTVELPHWFVLFIGAAEVLGGLGLVLPWALGIMPKLTPIAAALLAVVMAGAVVVSAFGGIAMAIFPFVILVLLLVVARGRWATNEGSYVKIL